jgi:phenylalanyl-tRNA synthetase beta chain
MVAAASERATSLILELAGGAADPALQVAGSEPALTGSVALHGDQVRGLLGAEISDAEIQALLGRLGLVAIDAEGAGSAGSAGAVEWRIPSFRQDLARPVDLIEEVARVCGLDRITPRLQACFAAPGAADAGYDFLLGLKRRLAALGFFEALTIKLVSAKQLTDAVGFDRRRIAPLALRNPLSADHTHLRPSLVPGLLEVAAHNVRQGATALRFFEAGTVFSGSADPKAGAVEAQALAFLLSGPHVPPSWHKKSPHPVDFADLRGVVDSLFSRGDLRLRKIEHGALALAAEVVVAGKVGGICGQLAPARAREIDARTAVFVAEFNLALLEPLLTRSVRFEGLPRFPGITRDVALEVDATLAHGQIEDFFARQIKEPLLERLELFDVFTDPTGEKLPAGRKSLAYSLTYRDRARTLEAKEVDAAHARVLDALKAKLPVSIR